MSETIDQLQRSLKPVANLLHGAAVDAATGGSSLIMSIIDRALKVLERKDVIIQIQIKTHEPTLDDLLNK